MNKLEEIVSTASVAVGVFGNTETSDYIVLAFPLPDQLSPDLVARGLSFVGVFGICAGQTRAVLNVSLDDATLTDLSVRFAQIVERAILEIQEIPTKHGDSLSWLESLYGLEDPRMA